MKQHIQQIAVQRALNPVARSIPTGLEQCDMTDTDENIQQQVYEGREAAAASYTRHKNKLRGLQTVVEEELAAPSQIGDMMTSSSAAASSSSASASASGHISDTAIVPTGPRTQAYEAQTSSDLRGSIDPPRWGHRRTQSSASAGSAASTAASAIELIPAHIQQATGIDILLEAPKYRRTELARRGTVADHQLAMEMRTIALGIEKLRSGGSESKTREAVKLYTTLMQRLIGILEAP